MQTTIIEQGTTLMLYGMGTVFAFLTLLVFATTLMSYLVSRFSSLNEAAESPSENNSIQSDQPSPQVLAAIKAAIKLHRNR